MEGTLNHFKKMLEGLCPNHAFPVKHLLKDYGLMRKFLAKSTNKGEQGKEPAPAADDTEEKDDGFPTPNGCLMIFRGSAAYDFRRSHVAKSTWPNRPHLPSSGGRSPP